MSDPDLQPGEEWRNRPSVLRQGARFGGIGCMGCLTFVVLAFLAVALLAYLGLHAHSSLILR